MKLGYWQHLLFAAAIAFSAACAAAPENSSSETSTNAPPTEAVDALPQGGGGQIDAVESRTLVVELYKLHDAQEGPFFERKRATIDRFFAKSLADMIWKDEQRPNDQVNAMGADPLYDAQDFELKNFKVNDGEVVADKATVTVGLRTSARQSVNFLMIRQGADWKINDIKYPAGYTLAGIYRENAKAEPEKPVNPSPSGEFEGTYRVGPTSCTV